MPDLYETPLSESALRVVLDLIGSSATRKSKCPVSASFVFRSLMALGASAERLRVAGVTAELPGHGGSFAAHNRDGVLYRVVLLVCQAALYVP